MSPVLALFLCCLSATYVSASVHLPEENLSVPELVRYWKYPVETHKVTTTDGYILTLHRVPYGKNHKRHTKNRQVVFLQHGLLASSSNWVTNLPHQSLGFMLADAGYDVWMGNVRGNTYSREHIKYDLKGDRYWDFTWDEMAKYDLPAMINKALNVTGRKELFYVGHSQGTMMSFAGLSQSSDLRKKIKVLFALAPVARLAHAESPIKELTHFTYGLTFITKILGMKDFLPSNNFVKMIADQVCPIDEIICENILFVLCGYDKTNMNVTRIPVYGSHTPAGTSVKNMIHFAQMFSGKKFQAYDYGHFKNKKIYGTIKPKVYNLSKVTVPVAIYSGGNDWLADPTDVSWLIKRLPHVIKDVSLKKYNHLDFIWGLNARTKVYKDMIHLMRKYNK